MRRVGLRLAFHGRLVLRRVGHEDRRVARADVGIGRILLDPVEHFGAVVEELLELGVAACAARAGESEGVAAIAHVRHPLAELHGIERGLSAIDGNGEEASRFAGDGIGALGFGHVVVEGEPERRAGTGRAAGGGDALLVDVPFAGLGAEELNGPRGILERPLHRRLDPGRLRLRGEAIVDRGDRDSVVEQLLEITHADLVAGDPAAAVDVDDERGGPGWSRL